MAATAMRILNLRMVRRVLQMFKLYPVREPHFFVIGTQKGGTTALYHSLKSHPGILAPIRRKEVHFFDTIGGLTASNMKAYQREFYPNWYRKDRMAFDATPKYLYDERCPELIHTYAPNAKLILLLREPVSRAFSQWIMERYKHESESRSFAEIALDLESDYIQRGKYAEQIERYLSYFPPENLLILDSELFKCDNENQLNRVAAFLEIPLNAMQPSQAHKAVKAVDKSAYEEAFEMLKAYYEPYNAELKRLLQTLGVEMSWLK